MHPVPEGFARAIVEVWGDEGAAWLRRLPEVVDSYARRWGLVVGPPFEPLSYNYVAPATRVDGVEVVLKLGVPRDEIRREIAALRLYAGEGAARVVDADDSACVVLLERLRPGRMLSTLADDERATTIAGQVVRRLWRPVPPDHQFLRLEEWFDGFRDLRRRFGGETGPLDARLVEEAETLSRELLASTTSPVLLHGDFHHLNVLSAERESWLAIDPKGIVGDPAYDTGPLFYNALPDKLDPSDLRRLLARRVDVLSEVVGLDRARVLGWGVAQAVLSAWWSLDDHGHGYEPTMRVAEALSRIRELGEA
jgi:streptomycin 6-kinase